MTTSLEATEAIAAKGATAPRVSLESMKDKIASVIWINAGEATKDVPAPDALKLITLCFVTMQNGFTVIGKSAPASAKNFDEEKGQTFAYEDAIRQLWPLEGYALREALFQ